MISDRSIIFVTQPNFAVNHSQNNFCLYRKNKSGKTKIVNCKNKNAYRKELGKYIGGFFEYSRDENKSATGLADYFLGGKKTDSEMTDSQMKREEMAILKDGSYLTDKEALKLQKNWLNYIESSNSHSAVMSFVNDYIDCNIDIKELQKLVATEIMPKFLKYCGYNDPKKNLDWVVAFHNDQDNYHFHIFWIEKNKCYETVNNRLQHRYRLTLTDKETAMIKRETIKTIERKKIYEPMFKDFQMNIESYENQIKNNNHNFFLKGMKDVELEEKILKLGFLLSKLRKDKEREINYNALPRNSVGKEIRSLTKDIKKQILKDRDLKQIDSRIEESLEKINKYFKSIDKDNNINSGYESIYENKMIKQKLERLDNFTLNAIVNFSFNNYKKQTSNKTANNNFNNLIFEIANEEYKKEKYPNLAREEILKKQKSKIIKNHLLSKYPYRKNIDRVLNKLLYEQDEIAEKFYEMLKENKYEK